MPRRDETITARVHAELIVPYAEFVWDYPHLVSFPISGDMLAVIATGDQTALDLRLYSQAGFEEDDDSDIAWLVCMQFSSVERVTDGEVSRGFLRHNLHTASTAGGPL